MVWIKNRANGLTAHRLCDTVRGATKEIYSNETDEEATDANGLTAFTSDGFSVGSTGGVNGSSNGIVAWCWNAGDSTVTNTEGSISSQVRANASAGFSIVTYTGNGTDGATVGHGLGVTPGMVIVKRRDVAQNWVVAHSGITLSTQSLALNLTTNATSFGDGWIDAWSSTTFTTNQGASSIVNVNANTGTYVAYCWSPVAGYSSFGSYTGNGSADGVFQWCGFRPRWILLKSTGANGASWTMFDTARSTYNQTDAYLFANAASAEGNAFPIDILSNGFKLRTSDGLLNSSSYSYVWAAFAENPTQNLYGAQSNAR